MATTNPMKGDVQFEAGDKKYTLRYSHLALVNLEKNLDKGLMSVIDEMSDLSKLRIGTVVSILWAGLQKHHPEITFEGAAEILDELEGGTGAAVTIIGEAFQKAFNAPGAGTKGTNPTMKEGNGTGTISSSSLPLSGTIPIPSGK